jgi:peptidoglycan/LPS O-acetylase OafA/YrhL
MEKKASARVYYLDWLRVLGMLAVLVYHSSRFFNVEDWHVKNPVWYPWVEVWNRFAVVWLMPLMFVISGASLFYALGKGGGAGKFVKDKVLRLLVPLVVGIFTHASLQVYLERLTPGQFTGSYFQFLPYYFQGVYGITEGGNFAVHGMHLWYLLYLFVFSLLLYPLLRWLRGRGRGVLSRLGGGLGLPGAVFGLALPVVLLEAFVDPNNPVMDIGDAGWPAIIYLWLVVAGFLVLSDERTQAGVQRLRWLSLALAVASTATYLVLSFQPAGLTFGTPLWAFALGLRGLGSWSWVLAALGFGRKHLNFSTPFVTYANEAVLPFYILHQTVLLGVGYFVVQWAVPGVLKWAIILLASFAVIMALYEFLVRRFNVMRFLFGMKPLVKQPAAQPTEARVAR